jgi:hypothetical protein
MRQLFVGVALALASTLPLLAQDAALDTTYKLVVDYDRPGLVVPHWKIVVPPRGMAQYTGAPIKGNDPGVVLFRISDAGRARLAAMLAHSNGMSPCETKSKGIANMGSKTIVYTPTTGDPVTCTFNYTENKSLSEASTYLIGVSTTLQAGLELERLHRYDRLGLDPAILRLMDDVKGGHATELLAIRPTLESLVTDPALLERVRAKAQQLLDMAKQDETATP